MITPFQLSLATFGLFLGSVILHEIAHGASALALGDDTAKRSGRLTLNPLPHLDPIGSLLLPAVLLLSHAGFVFGWAKPVPVNVSRLRHPRNDAVLTSLAGPATNLVLVAIAYVVMRRLQPIPYTWPFFLLVYLGVINLWLAAFNLLPVPPLDGSAVVERVIPNRWYADYLRVRPYTLIVVLGLVVVASYTGTIGTAYDWLIDHFLQATGYGALA